MNKNKIEIRHLEDFVKCPNFAKYNWDNSRKSSNSIYYQPIRNILMSCYRDMANLEKKVVWKTVRNRVHGELTVLLEHMDLKEYQKKAIRITESLRGWYIDRYRAGPEEAVSDLRLEGIVPATTMTIVAEVDAILLAPTGITLVEITDKYSNAVEAYNSIGLRTKIWLLSLQGVSITSALIVNIRDKTINTFSLTYSKPEDIVYKTERALSLITGSIKHTIFYPSLTEDCKTCPYRSICSW